MSSSKKEKCILLHANWLVKQTTGVPDKYEYVYEIPIELYVHLKAMPHRLLVRPLVVKELCVSINTPQSVLASKYDVDKSFISRLKKNYTF